MSKNKSECLYEKTGGSMIEPKETESSVFWSVRAVKETRTYKVSKSIEDIGTDKGEEKTSTGISVHGHVSLSDCSRWIKWNFDTYGYAKDDADEAAFNKDTIEKIDRAISQLTEFRAHLMNAQALAEQAGKQMQLPLS